MIVTIALTVKEYATLLMALGYAKGGAESRENDYLSEVFKELAETVMASADQSIHSSSTCKQNTEGVTNK